MGASSIRFIISLVIISSLCASSAARADDYGCQVLLCLSNPGGATQYAECVPPITKLYEDLAKGKPFPTCTGGGVATSAPVYDPYFCTGGHLLDYDRATPYCRSAARTETVDCPQESDDGPKPPFGGPVPVTENGHEVCKDFKYSAVQAYEKRSYIDVTIPATGATTRIRY